MDTQTVVIIGAGFSGTAVATTLLRLPQSQPLRVVLIERKRHVGGMAYGAAPFPYLLNVPAGRMSGNSLEPGEFLEFARRTQPTVTEHDFLPRALYGQYLESSLLRAARMAPGELRLERLNAEVIALERALRASAVHVHLDNGWRISADCVVLAPGNPPPAALPGSEKLSGGQYLGDPWAAANALRAGDQVLVVGSGLTMADVVLAATEATGGTARMHAISRRGLLPASQTSFRHAEEALDSAPVLRAASVSARQLLRTVRALATDQDLHGGDWRETITLVRKLAPALWQRLGPSERRRFLRHVRPYWDVHRHRLPGETWSAVNELRRSGALRVHAGRILDLEPARRQVRVTWRPRGQDNVVTMLVDRVVNCTGPDYGVRRSREPLLRSLIAQGIAVADPLDLGLLTGEFGALVDASGRTARNIYYIGPMLRANHWECTAVQELRVHAEALARHIAARPGALRRGTWQDQRWAVASAADYLALNP